jgi:hypothetical protein
MHLKIEEIDGHTTGSLESDGFSDLELTGLLFIELQRIAKLADQDDDGQPPELWPLEVQESEVKPDGESQP